MRLRTFTTVAIVVVSLAVSVLAVLGGRAVLAQDPGQAKYAVRVPNGLAFSEFKGYESWQLISISHSEKLLAATLGNPEMIKALGDALAGVKRNFETRTRAVQKNNPNIAGNPFYLKPWDLRDASTGDRSVPFGIDALVPAVNLQNSSESSAA